MLLDTWMRVIDQLLWLVAVIANPNPRTPAFVPYTTPLGTIAPQKLRKRCKDEGEYSHVHVAIANFPVSDQRSC